MAKKAAGTSKKVAGARKKRAAAKTRSAPSNKSQPIWTPSKFALWSERGIDPTDGSPTAVMIRHPTAPFPDEPVVVDQIDDATIDGRIRKLGFDYLTIVSELPQINQALDLPPPWRDHLDPEEDT